MYLQKEAFGTDLKIITHSKVPKSGLHVKNNEGYKVKVIIPEDCLALQVGAVLEAATGGWLKAHRHFVNVDSSMMGVSRETFALFMQPDIDQIVGPSQTYSKLVRHLAQQHRSIDGLEDLLNPTGPTFS